MRENLKNLVPYIGVAVLLLSPVFVSAQSAPLQSAGDEFLASLGSFLVHFLGTIHLLGNVDFGSIGLAGSGTAVPTVTPGTGWSGPTAQPAQIGANTDDAIGAWDVVPFQTYTGTFSVGVVAAHNAGIDHVAIACDGGSWTNISTPTYNPTTSTVEFWAQVNASAFSGDGEHECRAIIYPVSGVPRVLSSNVNVASVTYANPGVFTQPAHGYANTKEIVFSGSIAGGSCALVVGTTYYVVQQGLTGSTYEVSASKNGTPVNTSNCSAASLTVSPVNSADNELQYSPGESLFFNTNAGSHLNPSALIKYVDATNGVDNSTCGTDDIGSDACKTVSQSIANLVPSFSISTGSVSANIIAKVAHKLVAGQGITFNGSGLSPLVPNTLYWVSPTNFTANQFSVSATPGGAPIALTPNSSVVVSADVGGDTIYLEPGAYAYGSTTENGTRTALQQWLTITPAPGVLASNVSFNSIGTTNGVRTNKVHLENLTLDNTTNSFSLVTGFYLWMENITANGPGHTIVASQPTGDDNANWTGGIYWTGGVISNYEDGPEYATLVNGVTSNHMGQGDFSDDNVVINSTGSYTGEDQNDTAVTSGDTPSGSLTINFAAGQLPALLADDWFAWGNSCLPPVVSGYGDGNIASFTSTSITFPAGNATTCDIPSGSTLVIGTGFHPDFAFMNLGGVTDIMMDGLVGTTSINAEGIFFQDYASGQPGNFYSGYSDVAIVNNDVQAGATQGVNLQNVLNNVFVSGNSFSGGNFTSSGSQQLFPTDVIFKNTTCAAKITNTPFSGVTFDPASASCTN